MFAVHFQEAFEHAVHPVHTKTQTALCMFMSQYHEEHTDMPIQTLNTVCKTTTKAGDVFTANAVIACPMQWKNLRVCIVGRICTYALFLLPL